ncbi:hypothetical protein DUZ99_07550 [Xylanibacillus composti]|uniref:Uncharacterized protein n=1 Tax=Xylanibacillus composti TaxID=1572762 RepID=A0A8J4H186_9BACL|nr:hypothetical protein [Xylanibacillus composti]MDT9724847.1 hypothetical protein [Xylanibacillus composti]GIQ69058.1 hypothetical protein XYCOK13_18820 [Xylanibacillus composti]
MSNIKRSILFWLSLLCITIMVGCGRTDSGTQVHPTSVSNLQMPATPELSADETRASIKHAAAFDPKEVKAGDTIAGLTVKSIRTGDNPTQYAIVDLEGELTVNGYYYHTGAMLNFQPDLPSLELIPHVKDAYVLHYRDGVKVPRMPRFSFDVSSYDALASSAAGMGYATMVLSDYTIYYVPEANSWMTESVIQDGRLFMQLGEDLLPFGFRYIEDDATPISLAEEAEVHVLSLPDEATLDENGAIIWNDMTVRKDMLAAWFSSEDHLHASSLVGNHAALLQHELLSLPQIGNAHLLVVERDKWDDAIGHYNGVEYEYWIVVLREDPMVQLAGDDYMHAFCLIGVRDQQSEAAEQHMLELAALHWNVPSEEFYWND